MDHLFLYTCSLSKPSRNLPHVKEGRGNKDGTCVCTPHLGFDGRTFLILFDFSYLLFNRTVGTRRPDRVVKDEGRHTITLFLFEGGPTPPSTQRIYRLDETPSMYFTPVTPRPPWGSILVGWSGTRKVQGDPFLNKFSEINLKK